MKQLPPVVEVYDGGPDARGLTHNERIDPSCAGRMFPEQQGAGHEDEAHARDEPAFNRSFPQVPAARRRYHRLSACYDHARLAPSTAAPFCAASRSFHTAWNRGLNSGALRTARGVRRVVE